MRTPAKEALQAPPPASLRTANFARVRRGRLLGWLRLCPYPQSRGGSAPCRLRAQVVPRGLDPCGSPAAPGHARTSRLARWKPVSRRRDLLPRAPHATASPPDWPPTPCALRPSPFPRPVLHALPGLARALRFPAYWALDRLLGCWAPAARPSDQIRPSAAAALPSLLLVGLPLALPDLLLWLLLQARRRPFCYQPPPQCWAPPTPWRPPAEPARSFSFFSATVCLLPAGWRASAICRTASGGPRPWAPCCSPACGIRPTGLPAAVRQCRGCRARC
nr:sphingomyelin phosphodiesterase 5-like [Kogia breviceps]